MMMYSFAWVALMKRRLDYLQQEAGIENGTSCSAIPENCDCCHENGDNNGNVDDTKVVNNYQCQFLWVPPSSSHILTEPSLQGRLHRNNEAGRKDVVGDRPYYRW